MAPQGHGHCDIVQGTNYSGTEPAVLVLGLDVKPDVRGVLHVVVSVTCRAHWLPQDNFVQTSVCLACTGVDVQCVARGAELNARAPEHPLPAGQHSVVQRAERGYAVETPMALAGPTLHGKASAQAVVERSVQFSEHLQDRLSVKQLSPSMIEWSFELGRGLGNVRDYLNQTLRLEAVGYPATSNAEIWCTARPRSIGFFGTDNRRLGALQSTALYIKLLVLKVPLPAGSPVSLEWRYSNVMVEAGRPEVP